MKKFILVLGLLICIAFVLFAGSVARGYADSITPTVAVETPTSATLDLGTLVAKLPCLSQAVLYSWDSNSVKYAMSFTVISFLKDKINIDAMYVPSSEIGGLVSIKLFNLGEWVKFPLLEYIEFQPFVYFGLKNIGSGNQVLKSDADYGVGAKLISIKF